MGGAGVGFIGAIAAIACVPPAMAQPGTEEQHARARLVSEHLALVPGQTNSIAITFELDPHWHLYWKGQNDSGFAPKFEITVAPAMPVGDIQWPAPKRNILPGKILDHIYEDRVTLILPVDVPKEATGSVKFLARGEWLVCMEACVPGTADLTLTIPVGGPDAGKPSPDAPLFAAARERLPKAFPKKNAPVSVEFRDGVFVIKSSAAKHMAFYPAEDCVTLTDAIKDGATDKGELDLRLAEFPMSARLKGVLDLNPPRKDRKDPGKPAVYWVDFPIAAPGAGPAPAPGLRAPNPTPPTPPTPAPAKGP
jgi:thiol:disulfide interchange protein DsbD